MKARLSLLALVLAPALWAVRLDARAADLPKIDGRPAVADVNGQGIFLDDLEKQVSAIHVGRTEDQKAGHRQNPTIVLDRMITAELLAQEAQHIGLDEQPEAKRQFERSRLETIRNLLLARASKEIGPPAPAAIDAIYRNAVGEYRVRSILIPHEADAKDMQAKLKAGGSFDALASALVAAKRAQEGGDAGIWLKGVDLQPDVALALSKMKAGEVGPVSKIGKQFTILRLLEARFPENPEERERSRAIATAEKQRAGLDAYVKRLRDTYATVDRKLLAAVDYDKPGGLKALEADPRSLAKVKCGKDVSVGDLTAALEERFFHGADKAATMKKANAEKEKVLEDVLNRRVVECESAKLGLESTREFRASLSRARSAYLFEAFVKKAIAPDVKVEEKDLEAYLAAHASEFTEGETVRLETLAFVSRADAGAAASKLERGADFEWMRANAAGRAKADDPRLEAPPAGMVPLTSLTEEFRKAIEGAKAGDVRSCVGAGGLFYVVRVRERSAGKRLPLDAVREIVSKRVQQEKLAKLIEDWGAKLRKASNVKVFATGEDLTTIIMRDLSAGS